MGAVIVATTMHRVDGVGTNQTVNTSGLDGVAGQHVNVIRSRCSANWR